MAVASPVSQRLTVVGLLLLTFATGLVDARIRALEKSRLQFANSAADCQQQLLDRDKTINDNERQLNAFVDGLLIEMGAYEKGTSLLERIS